jgi:hypothetical protein
MAWLLQLKLSRLDVFPLLRALFTRRVDAKLRIISSLA